jgi:hypothetical protein
VIVTFPRKRQLASLEIALAMANIFAMQFGSGERAGSSHFTKKQMIATKSIKNISREHRFITFAIGDENGACDGKVPRFASW